MAKSAGSKTKKGSNQTSKPRVTRKETKVVAKPSKKVAKPAAKAAAKSPAVKVAAKKGAKPVVQKVAKTVSKSAPKAAVGKSAVKAVTKAAAVKAVVKKAPAKRAEPGKPVKSPAKRVSKEAGDPDPLLSMTLGPLKLVGGLDRDAQLPTSLVPRMDLPAAVPLTLNVQAVPGLAGNGNLHPANVLVLVTCAGWPVVDLNEDHFSVMEHFEMPGGGPSFSNNIVSFRNAGSGAYLLQIKPSGTAPWRAGQHLMQIVASSPDERHGQAAAKLIVR